MIRPQFLSSICGSTARVVKNTAVRLIAMIASQRSTEFVMEQLPARILVCDDDGDVRSVVGALLRDLGHTVWEVSNPILALQIVVR